MRLRRRLYARRTERALPNPIPGLRTGVLSTSELATIWQLPRARVKHAQLPRATVRRAIAPPEIERDPDRMLLRDERGPVSIAPDDRKYGHALIGGQGGGKSSVMARHFANDARDPDRAVILIDPKGPLAELCLGLVPAGRTVHYMDLGHPEVGFNPLSDRAPAPACAPPCSCRRSSRPTRAGAIQAASDSFLRQAVAAVCAVEPSRRSGTSTRCSTSARLQTTASTSSAPADRRRRATFARNYWENEFPALITDRGYAAQALNPPRNKIERLISTREIDTLLRHPVDTRPRKASSNAARCSSSPAPRPPSARTTRSSSPTCCSSCCTAPSRPSKTLPEPSRRRVSLLIDEAHNVLTPSVAKMLAEGRSAGLEAVFAWQYSAQIRDEVIRSGVRSLLQSISIFRMREIEDARSLAGLAMEVYSDRISVDQDEQERLRFSPDDVLKLPIHRAINLWVADGVPRAGFLGHTLPMEDLHDEQLAEQHLIAQRERGGHHPAVPARPRAATLNDQATTRRRPSRSPAHRSRSQPDGGRANRDAPGDDDTADGQGRLPRRLMLPRSYTELLRYDGAAVAARHRDDASCHARSSRATSRSSATSGATSS